MPSRKLAFFVAVQSVGAIVSLVPILGFAFGLEFSLLVWAVAGFRFWLLSIGSDIMTSLPSMMQAAMLGDATMEPTAALLKTALVTDPAFAYFLLAFDVSLLVAIPIMLYHIKGRLRKMLVKRLGSRML